MEKRVDREFYKIALSVFYLTAVAGLFFAAGIMWATQARAESSEGGKRIKVIYPKKTDLDFEGANIQGEVRNPGEFYFQKRPEEKFDSLVKRRPHFHREMLRDAVVSK